MDHVAAYEAKTHLPQLLARAAKGEQFTITKHGVPIAKLIPAKSNEKPDPAEAVAELMEFRRGRKRGKMSIREMIEEGRRF